MMLNKSKQVKNRIRKSMNDFFPVWRRELLKETNGKTRKRVGAVLDYMSVHEIKYAHLPFAANWLYKKDRDYPRNIHPYTRLHRAAMFAESFAIFATILDDVYENSYHRWGKPTLRASMGKEEAKRASFDFLFAVLEKSEKDLEMSLEEPLYKAYVRIWAGEFMQDVSIGTMEPTKKAFMDELPNIPLLHKLGEKRFSELNLSKEIGFTLKTSEKIYKLKNGTFGGFQLEIGARITGNMGKRDKQLLHRIGDYYGILNQIRNDLRNLIDLPRGLPSSDLRQCLYTLPILILSKDSEVRSRVEALMGSETSGPKEIRDILGCVKGSRNAKKIFFEKTKKYVNNLDDNIHKLPSSPSIAKELLFDYADWLNDEIWKMF